MMWRTFKHRRHLALRGRHRRPVSPLLRHRLGYGQVITAVTFGRICGFVAMGLFLLYYAHTMMQMGG